MLGGEAVPNHALLAEACPLHSERRRAKPLLQASAQLQPSSNRDPAVTSRPPRSAVRTRRAARSARPLHSAPRVLQGAPPSRAPWRPHSGRSPAKAGPESRVQPGAALSSGSGKPSYQDEHKS